MTEEDTDAQIRDMLSVPWEHEGAMIDELRKAGADEVVQKSMVSTVRFLNGVADELPDEMREAVQKLGVELYPRENPPLNNMRGVGSGDELEAEDTSDEDLDGHVDGPDKDGSAAGFGLSGRGRAPKVAAADTEEGGAEPDADDYESVVQKDFSSDQRQEMAGNGEALSDGSYPIPNKDYLERAIKALGRGKNNPKSKIKAHIIARAKALGADAMIPDTWVHKESAVAKALRVIENAVLGKSQDERPSTPDDPGDTTESDDPAGETVNKGGTVAESTIQVPIKKEDGSWDLSGVPDDARPFFVEMIEKADRTEAKLTAAEERLAQADDTLVTRDIVAKADEVRFVASPDELVPVLKAAKEKLDPETFGKLEAILTTANERIEKSELFTELGSRHGESSESAGDAWAKIEKAADDLVEKSDGISREAAIARVLDTPEGGRLYSQYLAESVGGAS